MTCQTQGKSHVTIASLTTEHIVIDRIRLDQQDTPVDEDTVRQLMTSIESVGLLQPIILHRPGTGLGVQLVFGRARLEACRRLKHRTVLARVANGNTDEIKEWCERAALDENNMRRNQFQTADPTVVSLIDRKRSAVAC